ncbi:NAD-dependent epimerase/dehydratase family protein [Candidatus Marithrix sp. Canyon 246]|uniref:NAD-dependent epimerase/dehydratase family protein n=1 Tax=Candidatus Marithrix sp. Canyon 246 TaxID=1827136 RepID=UPI000849F4DB
MTNQAAVAAFFSSEKPDYVILAAAKVGGIYANNTYPAAKLNGADSVTIWETGDDLADACLFIMQLAQPMLSQLIKN